MMIKKKSFWKKFVTLSMLAVMMFTFVTPVVAHADDDKSDDSSYVGVIPDIVKDVANDPNSYGLKGDTYAGDAWSTLAAGNKLLGISTQNMRTVTYSNLYNNTSGTAAENKMYKAQGDAATFGAALDNVGLDHSGYAGVQTDMFTLMGRGLFGGITLIGYGLNAGTYWLFKLLTMFAQYINIMDWISHAPTDTKNPFYGVQSTFYGYFELLRQFYLFVLTALFMITIGLALLGRRISKREKEVQSHSGIRHSLYRFLTRSLLIFVIPILFAFTIAGVINKVATIYNGTTDASVDYAIDSNLFDFQGWVEHSRLALPKSIDGQLIAGVNSDNLAYSQAPLSHQTILDMNVNGANSKAAYNAQQAYGQNQQQKQIDALSKNIASNEKTTKKEAKAAASGADSPSSDMIMRWFRYSQYQASDYASFIIAHMSKAYLKDDSHADNTYTADAYHNARNSGSGVLMSSLKQIGSTVGTAASNVKSYFTGDDNSGAKKGLGNVDDVKKELEKNGYTQNGHLFADGSKGHRRYFQMAGSAYSMYGDGSDGGKGIYDIASNPSLGSLGPGGLSTLGMYNYMASVFTGSGETWTESGKFTTMLTIPVHASVGLVGHGMVALGNLCNMYGLLISIFIINIFFLGFTFTSIVKSIPKLGLYAAMSFSIVYGIKLISGVILFSFEILGGAFLCQIFKQIIITISQMFDGFVTNPQVSIALNQTFGGKGNVAVGGALGSNAYGLANVISAAMLVWLSLLLVKWRGPIMNSIGKFIEDATNTIVQSFEATSGAKPTDFSRTGDPRRPFLDNSMPKDGQPERPDAPRDPRHPNDGKDGRPGAPGEGINGNPGGNGSDGVDGGGPGGPGGPGAIFGSGRKGSLSDVGTGVPGSKGEGNGKKGFFNRLREGKKNREAATGHPMSGREAMKYYTGKVARMGGDALLGSAVSGIGGGALHTFGDMGWNSLSKAGDKVSNFGDHLKGAEGRREQGDKDIIRGQQEEAAGWEGFRQSGVAERGHSDVGLYGKTNLGPMDANNYAQTVYDDMKGGAGGGLGVSGGPGHNAEKLTAEASNTKIHQAAGDLNRAKQQVKLAKTPAEKTQATRAYNAAHKTYSQARKAGSIRVAKQPVPQTIVQEGHSISKAQGIHNISDYGRNVSNLKKLQSSGAHPDAARQLAQKVQKQKQVLVQGGFKEQFLNDPKSMNNFLSSARKEILDAGTGKAVY